MEGRMDKVIKSAYDVLKAEGPNRALASIKDFFESNQEEIKEYFDAKSLEETNNEMKKRLTQIEGLVVDLQKDKPQEVAAFVRGVRAFLQEEFMHRAQMMQSNVN